MIGYHSGCEDDPEPGTTTDAGSKNAVPPVDVSDRDATHQQNKQQSEPMTEEPASQNDDGTTICRLLNLHILSIFYISFTYAARDFTAPHFL